MSGLTTLVDMPLISFPSTVAEEAFELKRKSFMCPLGINDFPMTNADHIKEGLSVLAKYRRLLLVHAEIQQELEDIADHPRSYSTYLKTREEAANRELLTVANDARAGGPAEGAHLHIVHLSDARSSLDLIKEAKSGDSNGDSTTIVFGALPHQKSLHRVLKMAVTDAGHQVVGSFLSESLQQQFSKHLASVMRILNVMQASTLDYQFIILPLLKSFMRELFEVLVDKDTKKKADAAREALLSEIELEAKKKKDFESKKKNKNQRKNKDPKVTQGDDLYVPQEETEEQVHFPVSYNGDYPSSVIVVAARADELGLQEEELKHEIEHDVEERKLEEKLEYQRQIAEEDKHTNLAKQNKHVVAASIAEEVEEMDVACATDLGPGLRNVGENNCFINMGQKNDASEAILDVLHWSFTFGYDTKITRKQLHRLGIHDHPNELLKCDIREKHQNSCGGCSKRNIPHCILSTPPRLGES
ncbi:unnamed protein product [Camellia sinensis]